MQLRSSSDFKLRHSDKIIQLLYFSYHDSTSCMDDDQAQIPVEKLEVEEEDARIKRIGALASLHCEFCLTFMQRP